MARSARSGTTDSDQAPAGAGPSRITPRQGSCVLLLDCSTARLLDDCHSTPDGPVSRQRGPKEPALLASAVVSLLTHAPFVIASRLGLWVLRPRVVPSSG